MLLVFLFHLQVPGFGAGFVGVDVFFVLSGFLITSLLLGELDRTGRISLAVFWARRARRLLPALLLLLVAVAIWARVGATFSERETLRADLLATTGYVANWHLISTSSYFEDTGTESLLQHTWSLAIEEQFYVLWPLVVAGAWAAFGRTRIGIGALSAVASIASVCLLAILWSPAGSDRAYMGTDARIFQPLIGAFGAVVVLNPVLRRFAQQHGGAILSMGAIGLAVSLVWIDPEGRGYFAGGALVVALASLMFVMPLWMGGAGVLEHVLAWRPLAWIGLVSYGIYLWHWPIVRLLGADTARGVGVVLRASAAVTLTLLAAAASFYLVERPIREGRLRTRSRPAHGPSRHRRTLAAVPIALLAVACVSVAATNTPAPPPQAPLIMIAGDSVPLHLQAAIERAGEDRGWRFVFATHGSCAVTGEVPTWPDGRPLRDAERCSPTVVDEQDELIRTARPDLVVWWDRFSVSSFIAADGRFFPSGSPRFWRERRVAMEGAVRRLGATGATVVFVGTEPPGVGTLAHCKGWDRRACSDWRRFQIDHYEDITARWNGMMQSFASNNPQLADFVSITERVCQTDRAPCNDRIDGIPARPDGSHYEGLGEKVAVEALLSQLAPLTGRGSAGVVAPRVLTNVVLVGRRAAGPSDPPAGLTVMLTGDSVPHQLAAALDAEARATLGWTVQRATVGACPVTGEALAWPDGTARRDPTKCPNDVRATQDAGLQTWSPDVVVWWDRQSIASFFTRRGTLVRAGTDRFWRIRNRHLAAAVGRLTSDGARVVFVATEPLGVGVHDLCPTWDSRACSWLRWRIDHFDGITQRWNRTMRRYASAHAQQAASVNINGSICRVVRSVCNDWYRGSLARPDGTHYVGEGERKAARVLVAAWSEALFPA